MYYDKEDVCKSWKVPFVTQSNDWISKCGTGYDVLKIQVYCS
jgi:hypothetical protein